MGAEHSYPYRVDGDLCGVRRCKPFMAEKRGHTRVNRCINADQRGVKRIMVLDLFYFKAIVVGKYRDIAKLDRGLCIDYRRLTTQKAFRVYFVHLPYLAQHCNNS